MFETSRKELRRCIQRRPKKRLGSANKTHHHSNKPKASNKQTRGKKRQRRQRILRRIKRIPVPSTSNTHTSRTLTVGGSTSSPVSTLASPSQTSALKLLTVALLHNCPFNLFAKLGLRIKCFGGRRSCSGTLSECGWSFGRAATAKIPSKLRGDGRAGSVGERERVGGERQQRSWAGILSGCC